MKKHYLSGSTQLKDGCWFIRYRLPNGQDSKRKLGPAWRKQGRPPEGYWTERSARMELDKLLSKYEGFTSGSDPAFKFAAAEFLTWCEKDRHLRPTTLHRYNQILSHDLLRALGEKRLSSITEDDMLELRGELAERVSASSLNQTRIVLSGVIKCARKIRRYKGEDPTDHFDRMPIKTETDIDVYSPAEIELLARTVREGKHRKDPERGLGVDGIKRALSASELLERKRLDAQDAVMFKTAAYAGLRRSELRALRWRDIDFAGSKIFVRSGYTDQGGDGATKSGKIRTVPMASQLAAELDGLSRRAEFTGAHDLVFCDAVGNFISGSGMYHRFVDATKAAGLRRLRFHDLRHTAATTFVQILPINEVKEILGHASITTTMVYLHQIPRHDAAKKIDDYLDSQLQLPDLKVADEVKS